MQEIDFFRTPYFLFKSDKNFAEKISDEIRDILKGKGRIDYINYGKKKFTNKIPVTPLSDLDFNISSGISMVIFFIFFHRFYEGAFSHNVKESFAGHCN